MARRHECFRRRGTRWLSLVVAAALAGCSDPGPVQPAIQPAPTGLVVSEPLAGMGSPRSAAAIRGAVSVSTQGEVYTSAEPGTFPDARSATVTNLTTGESVTAEVADGGFDPVALGGSPGDEIEVLVGFADGSSVGYRSLVPARKPPRVVRTRPTRDAVDVPLNITILVVFSEPVDAGTVTPDNVDIRLNGAPVATILTLDDAGLEAQLVPQQSFEPDTTYTLEITTGIADLTGDGLEEAVTVSFQTVPALTDQILFFSHSDEDWAKGIYDNEIYAMNPDGSGLLNLTNNPADDWGAAVSPDGTRILFATTRDGNLELYVMNADGSGLANLSRHPAADSRGVWSPDGTKIAFVSYRDAGPNACVGGVSTTLWPCPDIFVMNADGSNPVNLTNHPTDDDGWPAWSPDGTKIAFASNRAEPDSVPGSRNYDDIFAMNADGSNVVQLTDIDGPMLYGYWPAWSPDGTKIAFTGGPGTSGIWVMGADGSNPVRLTAGEQSVYQQGVWPSWSPDGARITFRACDLSINCVNTDVFVMNADGTDPINVTNRLGFQDAIGSPQAWAPHR